MTLVFERYRSYEIPRGSLSAGDVMYTGWEIFFYTIFDRDRRLSRKRY